MEIEDLKGQNLREHLVNVIDLIQEGSYSVAQDLLDWIIDQLQIHEINPEIGIYEMPKFEKEEEELRE